MRIPNRLCGPRLSNPSRKSSIVVAEPWSRSSPVAPAPNPESGSNELSSYFKDTTLDSLEAEHDPATPTEEALVVQLAMATWRLRRLYRAEAGFYTYKTQDTLDSKRSRHLDDAAHMGLIADRSNTTLDR